MGKRLFEAFAGAASIGLFAGLYSLTGKDLDPQTIAVAVIDAMIGYSGSNTAAVMLLENAKLALLIQGMLASLVLLLSILYCGKRGIVTAVCGYLGSLLLISGLGRGIDAAYLPIVLLGAGLLCAKYVPDRGKLKIFK